MKVAGIIRMGSSRLPGKVMLPFGEEPALGLLLVSCADKLDEVIVATTEEKPPHHPVLRKNRCKIVSRKRD